MKMDSKWEKISLNYHFNHQAKEPYHSLAANKTDRTKLYTQILRLSASNNWQLNQQALLYSDSWINFLGFSLSEIKEHDLFQFRPTPKWKKEKKDTKTPLSH